MGTMITDIKTDPKPREAIGTCHHTRNSGQSCAEDRRPKCESRPDEPAFDWQHGTCAETGYSYCCKYRYGAGPFYDLWYKTGTKSCPSDFDPSLGPCHAQQIALV